MTEEQQAMMSLFGALAVMIFVTFIALAVIGCTTSQGSPVSNSAAHHITPPRHAPPHCASHHDTPLRNATSKARRPQVMEIRP